MKDWDIYVYGDINIDLIVPDVDHLPSQGQEEVIPLMETHVGGGAALFLLGAAKLGLKTAFEGSVGDDLYGEYIRKVLTDRKVALDYFTTDPVRRTGISISFSNPADRGFLTMRGTNEDLDIGMVSVDHVKRARHIHMTGYAGSRNHEGYLKLLKAIRQEGGISVSFDVCWDETGEWYQGIRELFPYIDIMLMNETECCHYAHADNVDEAVKILAGGMDPADGECGPADGGRVPTCGSANGSSGTLFVIKMGSKGSMAVRGSEKAFCRPFKVKAVDTTGAGDSFNAGFVSAYLQGKSTEECLRIGNACGACSVTARGGNTAFPDEQGLKAFLKDQE